MAVTIFIDPEPNGVEALEAIQATVDVVSEFYWEPTDEYGEFTGWRTTIYIGHERDSTNLWEFVQRDFKDRNGYCAGHSGAEGEPGIDTCVNPHDHCKHGTYVGGCGVDWMCHACEMGDD